MINGRGRSDQSSVTCDGSGKRESADESNQKGSTPKLDLARDQNGRPTRAMIAVGTTANCS